MKHCHAVTFLPENTTIQVEHLKTIFETIGEENPRSVALRFACGAEGICRKCKIRALQKMGPLTPTEKGCLTAEELARGVRLACQARVVQPAQAEILYKTPFTVELTDEQLADPGLISPRVIKYYLPAEPGRSVTPDFVSGGLCRRAGEAAPHEAIEKALQERFASFFHDAPHDCTATLLEGELVSLEAGDSRHCLYAAAVDLGTNALSVSLIDLNTGRKIGVITDTNPQICLGIDLASRLDMVAQDPLNLDVLNEEILLRTDILLLELCRACSVSELHVYEVVIAGSTGMLHLYVLGIDGCAQRQGAGGRGGSYAAAQLSLRSTSRASVCTLPVLSAGLGSDVTAGILATKLHRSPDTVMLLDLGSDAKAVLRHDGAMAAASVCGCGVFDGAGMCCGMRPENGAIEGVACGGDIQLRIIGESLPRGICGSGMIELVAELKRCGLVDAVGKLTAPGGTGSGLLLRRCCRVHDEPAFLLYRDQAEFDTDIYITQTDIHRLMEAKARCAAMLTLLLHESRMWVEDIHTLFVAGAIGNHCSVAALVELGIVPRALANRAFFVGNLAHKGAQTVLLNKNSAREADELVHAVRCCALTGEQDLETFLHFLPWA